MKFVNLNNLGKWVITLAVVFSFVFGTLVENRLQVVQSLENAVVNVNEMILPAGNKIKERFDCYYKEAEKIYQTLTVGTTVSMTIVLSSLPRISNRGP